MVNITITTNFVEMPQALKGLALLSGFSPTFGRQANLTKIHRKDLYKSCVVWMYLVIHYTACVKMWYRQTPPKSMKMVFDVTKSSGIACLHTPTNPASSVR